MGLWGPPARGVNTCRAAPVAGYGCTYTFDPPVTLVAYATHLPSGEKLGLISVVERTPPNGAVLRVLSESVQAVNSLPFCSVKSSVSSTGDHASGKCLTPAGVFVRRSTPPVPSASCQKIPPSPSRSDWKAIRLLS